MDPFWMGVRADAETARVLVHAGPYPVLKARLPAVPQHPRALETLAEGVALWYNRPLSVALAVDAAEALSASPRWPAALDVLFHTPLVTIELVQGPPRRPRGGLGGLGAFADVRQLRLWEARA
jgi:hypothetical protein